MSSVISHKEHKAGWKTVRLGDVCVIRRGASPRPIQSYIQDSCKGGMPWVKIADATANDSRYITTTKECIIEEGVAHSVLVEPETFILSNSATPGLPKIMKITACVHDGWLVLSEFNGIGRDFLYYKCLDIRRHLVNKANGSVFQNLKSDTVREFEISLPPLETQKKIAAVLGALDDKIELNRKMNENLEAQAQALFKSWFVDFTPFGGKMPKGWKKCHLSEIADFIGGYSYKGNELQASTIAMATIKNFERNGGFKLDGFKEIVPSNKLKIEQEAGLFETLVAHTDLTQNAEVIGNAEMLLSTAGYERIIMSMDLVKVVPKGSVSKFLIGALLKNRKFKSHCLGFVNGTTVLHMSKSALREYVINLPDDITTLNSFVEQIEPLYRLIAKNIDESRKLAEMRDALLPKLMRGEISVSP